MKYVWGQASTGCHGSKSMIGKKIIGFVVARERGFECSSVSMKGNVSLA